MSEGVCPTCRRLTQDGLERNAIEYRKRPIFGTDFSRPLSEIVEGIRTDLARLRGRLHDIEHGYTGWRDRIESASGAMTCVLVTLHSVMRDMQQVEEQAATEAAGGES